MPNLQKVASNICSEKKKKSVMATWKKSIVAVKGSLSPKSEARLQLLSEEQIFTINCASCPSSLAAAAAKSLQLCPTLCDPIGSSPPGSPVPGILQTRTLEWVAISFSNAWKWKVKVKLLSHVRLFATPWTSAYQAPPSMRFSRQEYWSGVPLPSLTKMLRMVNRIGEYCNC